MTSVSIAVEPASAPGRTSELAGLWRHVSALMRFRNYPGQRRRRAKAAMRWLDTYVDHQR